MTIILKRICDPQTDTDGFRVLVDRPWPHGIKEEALALDLWAKEIAPNTALRQRYHQNGNFEAFRKDCTEELAHNEAFTSFCSELKKHKKITLLTASKVIDKSALPVLMQVIISYCPTDQTV